MDRDALLNELARLEHCQWKAWALRLLDTEALTDERTTRWLRYINSDWDSLTQEEKAKDLEWASKALEIFERHSG